MINDEPLRKPRIVANRRANIRPMKNVKASSTSTPVDESLVFSIAYMKPNAPARKTIMLSPPPMAAVMPVDTPTQAPSTVGTIDSANNQ